MQQLVTIREFGDTDSPWRYPNLDSDSGHLVPEDGDGTPFTVYAKNLRLERMADGKFRPEIKSIPSPATVAVTESRTVVTCHNYDKGGGWVGLGAGGLAIAAASNVVSKARAKKRSAGRAFALQIRHPWLKSVGSSAPQFWLDDNEVALVTKSHADDGGHLWRLVLILDKKVPAADLARDVASRAAAHALRFRDQYEEADIPKLNDLQTTPSLPDVRGQFAMHQLPRFFFVGRGEDQFTPDNLGLRHAIKVGNKFLDPRYSADVNKNAASRFGADLRSLIGNEQVFSLIHALVEDGDVHPGLLASYDGHAVVLWRRGDTGELRHELWNNASGGAELRTGGMIGVASDAPVLTVRGRKLAVPSTQLSHAIVQLVNVGKTS